MSWWKNAHAATLSGLALAAVIAQPLIKESRVGPVPLKISQSRLSDERPVAEVNSLHELNQNKGTPVAGQWLASIQSDAFGEQAIFEHLSTFEPLTDIMKKGIVSFDRKTLRSANYKEEEGYDILVYEIRHPLSAVSRILAELDQSQDGAPAVIRIVFLTGKPGDEKAEWVQFEGDVLASQKQVTWTEAARLFEHDLQDASTLMNASIR